MMQRERSRPRRRTRQRTEPGHTRDAYHRRRQQNCLNHPRSPGWRSVAYHRRFSFAPLALPTCTHPLHPLYSHHANITLPLCLHPVGRLHALPLLCWPHLRPCSTAQNAQRRACAAYLQIRSVGNTLCHSRSNRRTSI